MRAPFSPFVGSRVKNKSAGFASLAVVAVVGNVLAAVSLFVVVISVPPVGFCAVQAENTSKRRSAADKNLLNNAIKSTSFGIYLKIRA